jgi:hypothetical protein
MPELKFSGTESSGVPLGEQCLMNVDERLLVKSASERENIDFILLMFAVEIFFMSVVNQFPK